MFETGKPQLLSGERIIWEGRPYVGVILRPIEAALIPFSLLWGGFAVFWNATAWATGAPLFFKLFGLPFLVAGLYVTVGRFLIDMMLRRKMAYYVTNKRVIIDKRSTGNNTKSLDIGRLAALELDERADGSGSLRFGTSGGWFTGNNLGIWQSTFDPTPQFIRIPDVRTVYELVQKQSGG